MTHPQEEIETVKVNPDDLRAIAEKATPGKWERMGSLYPKGYDTKIVAYTGFAGETYIAAVCEPSVCAESAANAAHIAAFNPSTCLALLDELDGLKARVESAEGARYHWRQDAAARLLTWVGLMHSGLIGPADQVCVALLSPTIAMLREDADDEFAGGDAIDVDAVIALAESAASAHFTKHPEGKI